MEIKQHCKTRMAERGFDESMIYFMLDFAQESKSGWMILDDSSLPDINEYIEKFKSIAEFARKASKKLQKLDNKNS